MTGAVWLPLCLVRSKLKTRTGNTAKCDAEKLISLVEERRPIYDFSMKLYSNRGIQDKPWEDTFRHKRTSLVSVILFILLRLHIV
jgi:hypothetical protein